MNLGLKLVAAAGLLVTPMLAVDQSSQPNSRSEFQWDSRYEFRRSMERMRDDLWREFSEIRRDAWHAKLQLQRERYQVLREARQARIEALRARTRARIEARREIRDLRRHDRWF